MNPRLVAEIADGVIFAPCREAPNEVRDRPVVGTVRNPWAYYVSWYHFQLGHRQPNILFRICSDEGRLGFAATIANLAGIAGDEVRLAKLSEGLPEGYSNRGLNLVKTDIDELRERGAGFYSFLFERLYEGAPDPTILRVERLREDLRETLGDLGYLPNECAERFLRDAPAVNRSSHGDPDQYFTPSLAALVADKDRLLVDRFGYSL